MSGAEEACPALLVVIPVFNDWDAVRRLLIDLDRVLASSKVMGSLANSSPYVRVLLVDDGSTLPSTPVEEWAGLAAITQIDILRLRRNLGHQRAIAIGLTHAQVHGAEPVIVLMDGDGEDGPEDVPRLLEAFQAAGGETIAFAERSKRSESLAFRIGYRLYKWVHYLLTGYRVYVGNFSIIPRSALDRLVGVSELWNHYAAAVFHARIGFTSLPTPRRPRLEGHSRMNFVGLVIHGLSAISVYSDIVGVRLLVGVGMLALATLLGIATVVGVRLTTDLAIPGWATSTVGLLVLLLSQAILLGSAFVFLILGARQQATFLPLRDYSYFVLRLDKVYPR